MGGGGVRSEEMGQLAGRTRGTKGDGRNERRRQMGGGGVRKGKATTSQTPDERLGGARRVAGVVSRHGRWLLDSEGRHNGSSTAMDGATAPQRRGMARRLLDGEGWRDGYSAARDGAQQLLDGKGRCERGGNGPRAQRRWAAMDSGMAVLMVMDGAALRQWTARRQLDGEERCDGDLPTMDDEERPERDGHVNTAGGGSNKGQCVITL